MPQKTVDIDAAVVEHSIAAGGDVSESADRHSDYHRAAGSESEAGTGYPKWSAKTPAYPARIRATTDDCVGRRLAAQ